MIRIVTVFCLAVLVLEFILLMTKGILKWIFNKRPQFIAFLRSFKKGKFAVIYISAIPLYFVGHVYAGQDYLLAFFNSVNKTINLVALKYDTGSIQALMQDDLLYKYTIYIYFAMAGLNILIFAVSLTSQHIWCEIEAFKAMMTKRDKLFLFGNNPKNISIYHSDKKRNKVIIDDISDKECEKLYMNSIAFISTPSYESQIKKIFRLVGKFDREYIIVVNTEDDEKNISICKSVINNIKKAPLDIQNRLFIGTKVFVFGNPRYETIYEDIVSEGFGCIHYVNKYREIAIDFIDKYPFSKFMDEKQIDYKTSLIKNDVDINVFFIGFGKTNQQLFLTSVANNQFLTNGCSGIELKKVKYFIFDKDETENNKNLNHSYYRYKHECSELKPQEYLPLPSLPADETYYHLDVNDCKFYNQIRHIAAKNDRDVNFVVIAFGSDLENIDLAQKLTAKRKEWGIDNLVIFVKVRGWQKEQTVLEDESCYFIGNEKNVVYNIDKLLGDRIFHMAQERNEVYDLENDITNTSGIVVDDELVKKNHDAAYRSWYMTKSQMERESSLYCCLSLRSKLNLMGLDYCEANSSNEPGLSNNEYLSIYAGDDMPDTTYYSVTANGKPIVHYTLDFLPSRRRNMAIHEHQRWNSFMISKGMIPSSREQIASEKIVDKDGRERFTNGKNYAVRRHGNLTTFDGLVEFRKIIAARDKCSEAEKDVIKYDYQLLDDAHWLLESNGYKIVKNVKLK